MHKTPYVAGFDSSSAMLRATANHLRGKDFPNLGLMPGVMEPALNRVFGLANRLPSRTKVGLYTASTVSEAVSPKTLSKIDTEDMASWAVDHYPRRRYPAVMLGSTNGAAVHLCAALQIPWLPQSFLLPVRRFGVDPHEPVQEMRWARDPARLFLDDNPDLELHQMLDPVQDLLTSRGLSYFRVKFLRLPLAYKQFLDECLEPGGKIYLLECTLKWPTTSVGDRHVFQFGAPGGATIEEFMTGSPRVAEYLRQTGSQRERWEPPAPDGESPEAEWGFAPQLRDDVERYLRHRPYAMRRIVFKQPEHLSPVAAELYRKWYAERGLLANRLIAESFILLEPTWMLRVGGVPFWMVFSTEPMDQVLENWLDEQEPFDEIAITLFSHGVESPGLVPAARWRSILDRATKRGVFLGSDEHAYPQDLASLVRYHSQFPKVFSSRYPLPGPFELGRFEQFLQENQERHQVWWDRDIPEPLVALTQEAAL